MRFRIAIAVLLFAGGSAAAEAQRVSRVGYLQTATEEEQQHLTRAFEDAMRELGYVEGRNVVYERRFAGGDPAQLPGLARELVRIPVDVIVTGGNPVIGAVKDATRTIPTVATAARDPVAAGFIASYARPGGNITGVASDPTREVLAKDLELLHELAPRARRIAFLWNPASPGAATARSVAQDAAARRGLTLSVVEVRSRDGLQAAFAQMRSERADALWVPPDPLTFTARRQVVALADRDRLPAVYWQREFVDIGGLASYGSNLTQQFRRAAWYVDRILKGAAPGELAMEQASTFELVVNRRTAKELGLVVPRSLLLRADAVLP
jgi:putative ABC transport system substrate-binding protein